MYLTMLGFYNFFKKFNYVLMDFISDLPISIYLMATNDPVTVLRPL